MLRTSDIPQFTGDADACAALRADKYPTYLELVETCSVCGKEVNALYFDNATNICKGCLEESK